MKNNPKWVNMFEPRANDYPVIINENSDKVFVGIFNFTSEPYTGPITFKRAGQIPDKELRDFWTDEPIQSNCINIKPFSALGFYWCI